MIPNIPAGANTYLFVGQLIIPELLFSNLGVYTMK